jgi:hypothetical protein
MRWRLINGTATPRGFGNIKLCPASSTTDTSSICSNPIPMDLIAVDGSLFLRPQASTASQRMEFGPRQPGGFPRQVF